MWIRFSQKRHTIVTAAWEACLVKKILILTAGFGDGHNTAARNVADALEFVSDDVKVEVLDVFQSSLGIVNDILRKTYLGLARYAPGVWNGIYSMLDNSKSLEQKLLSFGKLKSALAGHPGLRAARLRALHLPGLWACHPGNLPRSFRKAVPLSSRW
jgi:hypothetical protein